MINLLKKKIQLAQVLHETRLIPNLPNDRVEILPDFSPSHTLVQSFEDEPSNPAWPRWQNDDRTPLRAVLRMDYLICIRRYTLQQHTDPGDCWRRTPTAWTFSGGMDGQTWEVIDQQSGQFGESTANGYTKEYAPKSGKFYRYLKLDFTANKGDPYWSIGQMRFYGARR